MTKRVCRTFLVMLTCGGVLFPAWAVAQSDAPLLDLPASSVQAVPASAVPAVTPTPADDYEAGIQADAKGDMIGALNLYKQAADAGYGPAQARYADNLKKGELVPDAVRYYRMGAQGNRDAQYGLGALYEVGEGVKQDFGVARFLYSMASEQGQREASIRLVEAYLKGQAGLEDADRQGPEALMWIRRAAGHDYLPAMDALAVAYREGKYGLTVDPEQADVIVGVTNKLRGVVVKEKKKSALFKLLKGDPAKKGDN